MHFFLPVICSLCCIMVTASVFRNNKNVTLSLYWQVIPNAGQTPRIRSVSKILEFPNQYVAIKQWPRTFWNSSKWEILNFECACKINVRGSVVIRDRELHPGIAGYYGYGCFSVSRFAEATARKRLWWGCKVHVYRIPNLLIALLLQIDCGRGPQLGPASIGPTKRRGIIM
jgi:hypothetical protein